MKFREETSVDCTLVHVPIVSTEPFAEKTFTDRHKTAKFAKVLSLENFALYSNYTEI